MRNGSFTLVRVKRDRVPDRVWTLLCRTIRPALTRFPLRQILTRPVRRDDWDPEGTPLED
ncbi:MAG: hypothetical protein JOZ41_02605 [Chloroflexi bacterium]|nr:hypothetical protein [Chloroflexota bacterium]